MNHSYLARNAPAHSYRPATLPRNQGFAKLFFQTLPEIAVCQQDFFLRMPYCKNHLPTVSKCHSQVVSSATSYSAGPGFDYWPRDYLSWM